MKTLKTLLVCGILWLTYGITYPIVDRMLRPIQVQNEVTNQFNGGYWGDAVNYSSNGYLFFIGLLALTLVLLIRSASMDLKKFLMLLCCCLPVFGTGCYRPFAPIKLEIISNTEEGFLIPFVDGGKGQAATNSEEFLTNSLVQTQQVKIPQQWVQKGYEYFGMPNGQWQDAAMLIKVDRAPVTCEWTADPMSGTSSKNEAVWVMTSDQVEFSTGWTCTARISTKEDAVKFLYNYPNGSIKDVMDREVRALVQTTFGLEVTDESMKKLREEATPHIIATVKHVTEFFKERGLTITNLGISGGFVYKDTKVQEKLVELFNSEQEKFIADAMAAAAQSKASGLADAARAEAEGKADAIKFIADAKAYEITQANKDLATYLKLKALEIEGQRVERWNGIFPKWYGGNGNPEVLLNVPIAELE